VKPLQSVAMGLVIVALFARAGGYDLLPDPVGWLLVLHGLHRLPRDLPLAGPLRPLGVVALLVSVALWFPPVVDGLVDTDESLLWVATLPQLAFVALLCLALSRQAAGAADQRSSSWLRSTAILTVVAALLPAVVFGAEEVELLAVMVVGATLVLLLVIVLLFRYAARGWAEPDVTPTEVDQTGAA
jgi:tellurite resistance protein TehA-like permease